MSGLDRLRERAIAAAGEALRAKGLSPSETTTLVDAVDAANLPGMLGVAGNGARSDGSTPPSGRDLLVPVSQAVAAHPDVQRTGLDERAIRHLLRAVFVERKRPEELLADPTVRAVVLGVAFKALAAQTGVDLSEDERRRLLEIVETGQFFGDAASATAVMAHAVPRMPLALVRDVRGTPTRIVRLGVSLGRDLVGAPLLVPRVIADLLDDGDFDRQPAILTETMRTLYGFGTIATTAETLRALLANDSVRFAILIYARLNGVPLESGDLDAVRESLDPAHPDLGPLVARGAARLVDQYGKGGAARLLSKMAV
jgi:hypothetical protein